MNADLRFFHPGEVTKSARFPVSALWLLALVPGNAVVLLDLERGEWRPSVWLARFLPALVVLTAVSWSLASKTPRARRLAKEFRLALPAALIALTISGSALLADTLPAGALLGLVTSMPAVLSALLPGVVVYQSFEVERASGTLAGLLQSSRVKTVLGEKYAVAALVVVVSWLQVSSALVPASELWWVALAGHVFGLFAAPAAFAFAASRAVTSRFSDTNAQGLGLGVLALPVLMLALLNAESSWSVIGLIVLALASVLALVLTPRLFTRELGSPRSAEVRSGLTLRFRALVPLRWRAEVQAQGEMVLFPVLGLTGLVLWALLQPEPGWALYCFPAVAALSPALAFAEPKRMGTLEALLAVQPRREVFFRKLAVSAAFVFVTAIVLPSLVMRGLSTMSAAGVGALAVSVLFAFSVGLLVAVLSPRAFTAFMVTCLVGGALFVLQVLSTVMAPFVLVDAVPVGPFLTASFVGSSLVMLAAAAWVFLGRIELKRGWLAGLAMTCLAQAFLLGMVGALWPESAT